MIRPRGNSPDNEERIRLLLECEVCRTKHAEDVDQVCLHPQRKECFREGWDGVLLSHVVVCPDCGAKDAYQLTDEADATLEREYVRAFRRKRLMDPTSPLVVAEGRIWTGQAIRRQSQGLRLLTELAAAHRRSGEAWRRLGNTERRLGMREAAMSHFLRACEVDEREAEAALNLAEMAWEEERFPDIGPWINTFLHRLGRSELTRKERLDRAVELVDLLRVLMPLSDEPVAMLAIWESERTSDGDGPDLSGFASDLTSTSASTGEHVVISSVDLRRVRRWEGLIEVLADPALIKAGLVSELPEDPDTILAARIAGQWPRIMTRLGAGVPRRPSARATKPGRKRNTKAGKKGATRNRKKGTKKKS